VQTYLAANFPQDTLLHAFVKSSGDYIVISSNNGLFATVFTSSGTFVTHVSITTHDSHIAPITADALPAAITGYLTNNYPGYVFEKAFSFTQSGTIKGYCVIIDSNNTKYGLLFDGSGAFIRVKVIR
jgi:hypothetical protein